MTMSLTPDKKYYLIFFAFHGIGSTLPPPSYLKLIMALSLTTTQKKIKTKREVKKPPLKMC
jgi:hypothetical protein